MGLYIVSLDVEFAILANSEHEAKEGFFRVVGASDVDCREVTRYDDLPSHQRRQPPWKADGTLHNEDADVIAERIEEERERLAQEQEAADA